jgi:hypothetical protein
MHIAYQTFFTVSSPESGILLAQTIDTIIVRDFELRDWPPAILLHYLRAHD